MLDYKWSSMSLSALVHLGEKKTEEYRKIIDRMNSPRDVGEDGI